MVIVTVAVSLPVAFVAVTTKAVEESVSVGVPEKRPVDVEKVMPPGNDGGEAIDQLLITPPVFVGITVVNAEFTFPETTPEDGYVISGANNPDEVITVTEVAAVLFWPALSVTLFEVRPIVKFPAVGIDPPVPGTNSTVKIRLLAATSWASCAVQLVEAPDNDRSPEAKPVTTSLNVMVTVKGWLNKVLPGADNVAVGTASAFVLKEY
jgi:hypothetical protein